MEEESSNFGSHQLLEDSTAKGQQKHGVFDLLISDLGHLSYTTSAIPNIRLLLIVFLILIASTGLPTEITVLSNPIEKVFAYFCQILTLSPDHFTSFTFRTILLGGLIFTIVLEIVFFLYILARYFFNNPPGTTTLRLWIFYSRIFMLLPSLPLGKHFGVYMYRLSYDTNVNDYCGHLLSCFITGIVWCSLHYLTEALCNKSSYPRNNDTSQVSADNTTFDYILSIYPVLLAALWPYIHTFLSPFTTNAIFSLLLFIMNSYCIYYLYHNFPFLHPQANASLIFSLITSFFVSLIYFATSHLIFHITAIVVCTIIGALVFRQTRHICFNLSKSERIASSRHSTQITPLDTSPLGADLDFPHSTADHPTTINSLDGHIDTSADQQNDQQADHQNIQENDQQNNKNQFIDKDIISSPIITPTSSVIEAKEVPIETMREEIDTTQSVMTCHCQDIFCITFMGINLVIMVLLNAVAATRMPVGTGALPDLIHDQYPVSSALRVSPFAGSFQISNCVCLITAGLMISGAFMWKDGFNVRRGVFLYGLLALFRAGAFVITSMPAPCAGLPNCPCADPEQLKLLRAANPFKIAFSWLFGLGMFLTYPQCGDLIVSGHTMYMWMSMRIVQDNIRIYMRPMISKMFNNALMLLVIGAAYHIMLMRNHYAVDVYFGALLTEILWNLLIYLENCARDPPKENDPILLKFMRWMQYREKPLRLNPKEEEFSSDEDIQSDPIL